MKPRSAALLTSKMTFALLSVSIIFLLTANARLSAGKFTRRSPAKATYGLRPVRMVLWHAGNFRHLPSGAGNLHDYVGSLVPLFRPGGGYGRVSSTRAQKFNLFLDSLFAAIENSLADGANGDWCGVQAKAADAGYEIIRYYDNVSGRWFVHAKDSTSFGQTYFFINPFAKRNLVIEVPHHGYEAGTALEGARLFTSLAARALIINKEDRCSDPDTARCEYGQSTACDDDRPRESDVAHNTDNTFHLLHVRFNDMDIETKFVQLHGFLYDSSKHTQKAVIGDGTTDDVSPDSFSVIFGDHLRSKVQSASAVGSCQETAGKPDPPFCGEANAQGRYTNNGDACSFTGNYTPRFLHIEQAPTLRDDDESGDGMSWNDIKDALILTWGECNMNNGATDCALGPQQTQYSTLVCP